MTAEPKKIGSIGFVDTYENGHFTGWTYTNSRAEQKIIFKLNGHVITEVMANALRPDVKAAGIEQGNCGFNFKLNLEDLPKDGCFISMHESVFGELLGNGTFVCRNGIITPQTAMDFDPGLIPVSSYVSIYDAAGASQDSAALVDLCMEVLGRLPPNTLMAMSYLLLLGRIPDPEGFRGSLRHKVSSDLEKRHFLSNVIGSAEFVAKRSVAAATADVKKFAT
jgi:hypothetical protein